MKVLAIGSDNKKNLLQNRQEDIIIYNIATHPWSIFSDRISNHGSILKDKLKLIDMCEDFHTFQSLNRQPYFRCQFEIGDYYIHHTDDVTIILNYIQKGDIYKKNEVKVNRKIFQIFYDRCQHFCIDGREYIDQNL